MTAEMMLLNRDEATKLFELGRVRGRAEVCHEIVQVLKAHPLDPEDAMLAYIEATLLKMSPPDPGSIERDSDG